MGQWYFKWSNGVQQGYVVSPILFRDCMDSLVDELGDSKTACWVEHSFYGVLIYADDKVLTGLNK